MIAFSTRASPELAPTPTEHLTPHPSHPLDRVPSSTTRSPANGSRNRYLAYHRWTPLASRKAGTIWLKLQVSSAPHLVVPLGGGSEIASAS